MQTEAVLEYADQCIRTGLIRSDRNFRAKAFFDCTFDAS
jgi:hypothetical protein